MEKKFEVFEQNFTKGKAVHYVIMCKIKFHD